MFLENKYTKLYFKLTAVCDNSAYTENHHIIPRCMGGTDDPKNLVRISARKHFLCHYLLIKMVKRSPKFYKLIKAFSDMRCSNRYQSRYFNSRLYENYRKDFSKSMSISQTGSSNSQFGTSWIYCPMTLVSRKVPKNDLETYLEKGCVKGRIQNIEKFITKNQPKMKTKRKTRKKKYNLVFLNVCRNCKNITINKSFCSKKCQKNNPDFKNVKSIFEHFKNSNLGYVKYTEKYYPTYHYTYINKLFKKANL